MKTLLTMLFGAILITICGQVGIKKINAPQTNESYTQTIILTSDTTYAVIKFNSEDTWIFKNSKPIDLSFNEIAELDKIILECVNNYKDELLDIKKYKRQYIPAINDNGEKLVWINCFCKHFDYDWKNQVIMVVDGGNCYFQMKINLTTKKYYNFHNNMNGGE